MKSICFFCHFHNGDVFHIKSFVKEVISEVNTKFYIAHPNNQIITSDLNIEYINIPYSNMSVNASKSRQNTTNNDHQKHIDILNNSEHSKFIDTPECLYINTWIGGYFSPDNEYTGECSLRGFYRMFSFIYEKINEQFSTDLKLKSLEEYYPFVDYSKVDVSNIDSFLKKNTTEKVLVCNGPTLSQQTTYNSDMSEILNSIAEKNPDKTFIVTKKFSTHNDNIVCSDEIIKADNCDLNEISYLSKFCKLIIGKNSGPFCFTLTKENLNDESKTFFSFGSSELQCLAYGMNPKCSFVYEYYESIEKISKTISELLELIK